MAWHLYARGTASGVYLQNAPLFPTNLPTDIRWGFNAIWNLSIIVTTTPAIFEFTLDGGITWFPLNPISGVNRAIPPDDERTFNIKATDKESFNLRCVDGGGCTIYRVLVSIAPQDVMRPRSDIDVNVPNPLPVDICPVDCVLDVDLNKAPTLEINQRLMIQKLKDIEDVLYLIVLQLQDITGTKYSIRDVPRDVRSGR